MQPPIWLTASLFNGTRPVDYKKGKHDIYALRYDDPSEYAKERQGDVRFWMNFHADWYALVILCKSHPTTEMKSINWEYLFEIDLPVVREVQDACRRMYLTSIMSFNYDWNEEVTAQFYSTFYVNRSTKTFHRTIQGKPFMLNMLTLLVFLGFTMLILQERGYMRRRMCLMMENFTSCMTVHMVTLNLQQYMD
jgi:hypothetical protein